MTPENFCYWLQGRAELCKDAPTKREWEAIRRHLALVFENRTNHEVTYTFPLYPDIAIPGKPIC